MCWVRTLIFKNFHIFYSLTNKLSKQGKYILLITVSCSFLLEKFCFPNVLVINFFVNVEAMKMVNFLASKKMCWVRTLIFKNFHIFYSLTNKLSKQGKYILLITVSCSFLLEKFCFPNVLVINFFVNVEAMKMVNFLASKKMCWVRTLIFKNFHIFYSLTNYQNIRANASSQ